MPSTNRFLISQLLCKRLGHGEPGLNGVEAFLRHLGGILPIASLPQGKGKTTKTPAISRDLRQFMAVSQSIVVQVLIGTT